MKPVSLDLLIENIISSSKSGYVSFQDRQEKEVPAGVHFLLSTRKYPYKVQLGLRGLTKICMWCIPHPHTRAVLVQSLYSNHQYPLLHASMNWIDAREKAVHALQFLCFLLSDSSKLDQRHTDSVTAVTDYFCKQKV